MIASYKFVQKLWILHEKIKKIINENNTGKTDEINKFTNQLIKKVNNNLERFNYNVIIANMYETYNFLIKKTDEKIDSQNLKENYQKILTIISPIIPHFASECLEDLSLSNVQKWPKLEEKFLENDTTNYVIQIDGRKRAMMNYSIDASKEELLNEIKKTEVFEKFLKNKKIQKSFFVKNKLINILIND